MIRFVLRVGRGDDPDDPVPPQAAFAVIDVDLDKTHILGPVHVIGVSTEQLQEIVSRLWVLLPLADRPIPRTPPPS